MGAVWAFAFDHGAGGDGDGVAGQDPAQGDFERARPEPRSRHSSMKSNCRKFGVPSNLNFGIPARSAGGDMEVGLEHAPRPGGLIGDGQELGASLQTLTSPTSMPVGP